MATYIYYQDIADFPLDVDGKFILQDVKNVQTLLGDGSSTSRPAHYMKYVGIKQFHSSLVLVAVGV